jgi:hypothetical protein
MQEINTENIYKYLQPEKSGEFKKSLLFAKNRVVLRNPCFLLKIRRILEILAFCQKSGEFTESLRLQKIRQIYRILAPTENQGDDRILVGVEIPAPGKN